MIVTLNVEFVLNGKRKTNRYCSYSVSEDKTNGSSLLNAELNLGVKDVQFVNNNIHKTARSLVGC